MKSGYVGGGGHRREVGPSGQAACTDFRGCSDPEVLVLQTPVLSAPTTGQVRRTAPGFFCTLRDGGLDTAWVHGAGELDLATAPLLEQTLRRAEIRPRVVLDLRELAFVDCLASA
jgi:hypothetical protein